MIMHQERAAHKGRSTKNNRRFCQKVARQLLTVLPLRHIPDASVKQGSRRQNTPIDFISVRKAMSYAERHKRQHCHTSAALSKLSLHFNYTSPLLCTQHFQNT